MKNLKRLISVFSVLCVFLTEASCQQNLNGNWHYLTTSTDFSLFIKQSNNVITGNHCSTMGGGTYDDCADSTVITLNGIIQGDSAIVTFKSVSCSKKGEAVIKKLTDSAISWRITKKPDGKFYIPKNVVLKKD